MCQLCLDWSAEYSVGCNAAYIVFLPFINRKRCRPLRCCAATFAPVVLVIHAAELLYPDLAPTVSCITQVAIHAIGDQAVEDVLAWYDNARTYTEAHGGRAMLLPGRHRIEHAQHLLGPDTLAAMAAQQTVAVVNPLHLLSDMHIMEERLGRDRIGPDRAFAYKAMLKVLLSHDFLMCGMAGALLCAMLASKQAVMLFGLVTVYPWQIWYLQCYL